MFRPGSIRKIEVKNFVTYSHAEMYLGPNLNMIIGPNGTGKSTMVAAIILGLGGTPKTVGRGSKVSEYVKHNCEFATINLFLQEEDDNKFIKVTREFDIHDKTTWKLNSRKVTTSDVLEYIRKFNIQVNNLCQFLPQDRVQEFAKMNKQDLLKETQKALCRFDLIEKQDALIGSRDQSNKMVDSISACQKKIQECHDLNSRLEGRVQNFNKMKEYTEKIQHIERKIAWVMYEGIRGQLTDVKKDRNKAQEVYEKYRNEMKPMENDIGLSKRKITDLQQNNNKVAQLIRNSETTIKRSLESVDSVNESLKTLNDEMETKLAEIEQWDKEIENAANKLQELKISQKEMKTNGESEHQRQILFTEMTNLSKLKNKLQDKREEILQRKQDDSLSIHAFENESQRLENVKQTRLQYLQRTNPHAYEAVIWVRNNKHLFKGEVYEPIMLELNILETKHAKYVENVIPFRDRLAFTCTCKEDMNRLIKTLREEKKLGINVVHSSAEDSAQYRPNVAIEYLIKYGFYTYMNNLFTAPVPIMNYLCRTYRLHNIPLGDVKTDEFYEEVPKQITLFFSTKYRYSVSISKYSGQKSVRQVEVNSDGSLSFSLDIIRINQLKGQIAEIHRRITNYDTQNQTVDEQLGALENKILEKRSRLKEIVQQEHNAQALARKVESLQNKLSEMKKKKSVDDIRMEYKRRGKQLLKSIPDKYNAIKREISKLTEQETKSVIHTRKIEEIRKSLAFLENVIKEKRVQCQDAEETLNRVKDRYNEIMEEAKSFLQKAKGLSKGFTPADEGFEQFREEYEALSSEVEELDEVRRCLQSRVACLNVADDGEMQEYEDRLKQIDKLTKDLDRHNTNLNKATMKISKLEDEWLGPLKELLAEISLKFASAFEKLGCAGEVSICTGENDRDFSQYGISIKVTYRSGEPLQELNSTIQSGGERAVATAAYMLSLQKLTPVPFRCVDEINQGMDATNERRIFELVVDSTCQDSTSQYFLITPKLIPHLNYSPNMLIHIVHNGPFVAQDKKWGFSKVCNPQKTQIV